MRPMRILGALLAVALLQARAVAEDKAPGDYVLGPEDVIEISVLNHNDLNKRMAILPDGKIVFPEVGEMKAAGRTPKQLAAEIQAGLEKVRNNVSVSVSVLEIHSRRVRIIGAVRSPSAYDLKKNWRVIDLVAVAGGLTTKPSRISGRIIRNGVVLPLDYNHANAKPDSNDNALLEPDDLVLLDEIDVARSQIQIVGAVAKPGLYDLEESTNILGLLTQAGGATDVAAMSRAYVQRGGQRIPLDLSKGPTDEAMLTFKLKASDVIDIPETKDEFRVGGSVLRPGRFTLPEKKQITVQDALNVAGGKLPDANLSRAVLFRSEKGQIKPIPINMEAIGKNGDLSGNVALQPDDLLMIPARGKRGPTLGDLFSPLSLLYLLGFRLGR